MTDFEDEGDARAWVLRMEFRAVPGLAEVPPDPQVPGSLLILTSGVGPVVIFPPIDDEGDPATLLDSTGEIARIRKRFEDAGFVLDDLTWSVTRRETGEVMS